MYNFETVILLNINCNNNKSKNIINYQMAVHDLYLVILIVVE